MYNLRSIQAPTALPPNVVQNPKSILSDKNYAQDVLDRSANLRVTFAKLHNPNSYLSSTSTMLSDPAQISKLMANAKRQRGSSNEGQKLHHHRLGTAENEGKQKAVRATTAPVAATGSKKSFSTGSGELAELYRILNTTSPVVEKPSRGSSAATEANKKKTKKVKSKRSLKSKSTISKLVKNTDSGINSNKGSVRGSLVDTPLTRTIPSKSKKLNKLKSKTGTDLPKSKRSKTGRKKKKSNKGLTDEDLVMFKPAKLDEEYVSELDKIKTILKAVSAFDEGTSTKQAPESSLSSSARVKTISHYHYENDGGRGSSAKMLSGASSKDARPLSAEELKQLLSSITRVVSLHQLPINGPVQPSEPESQSRVKQSAETIPSLKGLDLSKDELNTNEKATETPHKKKKAKKTRSNSSVMKPTAASVSKVTTKSKGSTAVKKNPGSKRKVIKGNTLVSLSRTKSSSSISSNERDPVKNARFLKKYFEESVRLASKKSSDDLLQEKTKNGLQKPGKTKVKTKTVYNKNGVKPPAWN